MNKQKKERKLYNFEVKPKKLRKKSKVEVKQKTNDNEIVIGVTKYTKEEKKAPKKKNDKEKVAINNKKHAKIVKDKDNKRTKEKNKKIKNKDIKVLKWTCLLILVATLTIFSMISPIFNIENIKVKGNKKISEDKIIGLSEIAKGNNIFRINKKEITNKIKTNGYIDSVNIKRVFPNSIEILVTERKSTFVIEVGSAYAYINNQGYVLELSNTKINVPKIEGIETKRENIKEGNRLIDNDLKKLETLLKIISEAEINEIKDIITSVDITDSNNYILNFDSENKKAYLGDCTDIASRMSNLKVILKSEIGKAGEIFVNMNLNLQNPFFRESV